MEKHIMLDIESTGIDPDKEDLLQIGALEVEFKGGFWLPGRSHEMTMHSGAQPTSSFAKEHMVDLYRRCNAIPPCSSEFARDALLLFIQDCGVTPPDVYFMGWNASNFDIPFLVHKGILRPSSYVPGPDGKDVRVGDFHYRVYEIGGSVSLAQNVLGFSDRTALLDAAKAAYPMALPEGKQHDALYDCYSQLQLLNGLITLCRARSFQLPASK